MRHYLIFGLMLNACLACTSTSPDEGQGLEIDIALSGLYQPRDATADLVTQRVYTLAGGDGAWALLSAPLTGGVPVELASFIDPRNLVLADDGNLVYVADRGGVFQVSALGGDATVVSGTEGYQPEGLDYDESAGKGELVFTGNDPNGQPGLFRVAADGGVVEVLMRGAPFVAPAGVDVASDGRIWLADAAAGKGGTGAVFAYGVDGLTHVVDGFAPGNPTGLALNGAGTLALISALDETGHSMALALDTTTKQTSIINEVIGANRNSGGLHRAGIANDGAEVFVWSNASGFETNVGTVYILRDLPQFSPGITIPNLADLG